MESQCLSHLIKITVLWIPYPSEFQICFKNNEISTFSRSISQQVHQYTVRPASKLNWKWSKSGSGAPGPKSAPRDTKSTIFAKGFFSHPIYGNTSWNTFRIISLCNKVCNNVCNNVCSNVCNIASDNVCMTCVHPNCKSISSANPHPQPPYQALAWSYR